MDAAVKFLHGQSNLRIEFNFRIKASYFISNNTLFCLKLPKTKFLKSTKGLRNKFYLVFQAENR